MEDLFKVNLLLAGLGMLAGGKEMRDEVRYNNITCLHHTGCTRTHTEAQTTDLLSGHNNYYL